MPQPALTLARSATVAVGAAADLVEVVLRGDLDFDAGRRLQHRLYDILARSAGGVDLDLSAVGFCDCSGLNLLLWLREQAAAHGKTLTVRTASPTVERLLDLTGAREVFTRS
ncbi:STAS domain-containing protein [Streptomyces sp. NPDC001348]